MRIALSVISYCSLVGLWRRISEHALQVYVSCLILLSVALVFALNRGTIVITW